MSNDKSVELAERLTVGIVSACLNVDHLDAVGEKQEACLGEVIDCLVLAVKSLDEYVRLRRYDSAMNN